MVAVTRDTVVSVVVVVLNFVGKLRGLLKEVVQEKSFFPGASLLQLCAYTVMRKILGETSAFVY